MLQTAKIKVKDIKELREEITSSQVTNGSLCKPPLRKRKNPRKAINPSQKTIETQEADSKNVISDKTVVKTKPVPGTAKKFVHLEQPSAQKRIDSYFPTCQKTYKIKDKSPATLVKDVSQRKSISTRVTNKKQTNTRRGKKGRKRLFVDSATEAETVSSGGLSTCKKGRKNINNKMPKMESIVIDDSEDEMENNNKNNKTPENQTPIVTLTNKDPNMSLISSLHESTKSKNGITNTNNNSHSHSSGSKTIDAINNDNGTTSTATTISSTAKFSRRKLKPCPPYKVIEDTTFAVDAFQFGYIENVTHYFLTHFHADHYIGLTKSFAMPIYMSPITARFLRAFISVEEQYIHELELNQTYTIEGIEVTALDANHCPGSILLVFKFPNINKCILHTGDFRAWHGMESEPIFWNNDIHTIYLDTTYISDKYAFCSQDESLLKAYDLIEKFQVKHEDKRILYICGSYVIGKEKFWSQLAENYKLKVWAEGNRGKALNALNDKQINKLLVDQPQDANMHVIAMGKLSYLHLVDYFKNFEHLYDLVFAIRPSGWEKDSKPQYRGKINIIGIEYSEHSSYAEMKRFVKFLKPKKVLSTVPTGRDLMFTAKVPVNWYKYDKPKSSSNYQPTIATYLKKTPHKKTIQPPSSEMDGIENFVSPLIPTKLAENSFIREQIQSTNSPEHASDKDTQNKEQHTLKDRNKTEIQKKTANSENCGIFIAKTSTETGTSKGFANNSSEEFEKADITLTQNRPHRVKRQSVKENDTKTTRNVQEKNKNTIRSTQEKVKSNKKSSKQNQPQPDVAQTRRKSLRIDKQSKKPLDKEIETHNTINLKQELIPSKISINSSSKQANQSIPTVILNANAIQDDQIMSEESTPISSKVKVVASLRKDKRKSNKNLQKTIKIDYTSEEEFEATTVLITRSQITKLPLPQEIIPASQKVVGKQKILTTSSTSSRTHKENGFEKESRSISKPNERKNTKKGKFQKNPILKSTTTTNSITSTVSTEVIPATQRTNDSTHRILRNKYSKKALQNSNHDSDEDFSGIKNNESNFPQKSVQDLTVLSQCLVPLKESNQPLDTKVILKTIMENSPDLERINCTQLAGLVMETLNEKNSDKSKYHIPADLLSMTDDESVLDQISNNYLDELPSSSLRKRKRLSFTTNDHNLTTLHNSKTNKTNTANNFLSNKCDKDILPSTALSGHKKRSVGSKNTSLPNTDILSHTTSNNKSDLPFLAPSGHKRPSLVSIAQTLTPLKKSKQPLDVKAILETIMDTNKEDLNNVSCTQLAGLIVDTINEQNPDNSKDHIPLDLLSDADDDWM